MKLTISEGNVKIGKRIPNISLPPGISCVPGVRCFDDGCYAMKAYRMYPNVRAAWDGNLELWRNSPADFLAQLEEYLWRTKPERFRWHVGGDIPDQIYADNIKNLAGWFGDTKFLCFTKRYDLDFSGDRDNLSIVLSAWPGMELVNNLGLPVAWLAEDDRAPIKESHIRCPGHCGECEYKCWGALNNKLSVIFDKH